MRKVTDELCLRPRGGAPHVSGPAVLLPLEWREIMGKIPLHTQPSIAWKMAGAPIQSKPPGIIHLFMKEY